MSKAVTETIGRTDCPDCGVAPGEAHLPNCDVEQCSVCKGQRLMCVMSGRACSGHDPQSSYWTGEWPGKALCREKGWYSVLFEGHGWLPCTADYPGATEDLNRLTVFEMTGTDPGAERVLQPGEFPPGGPFAYDARMERYVRRAGVRE